MQTMASMNYFDSNRRNLSYFFKWKSEMEIHVIAKTANLHAYSCFSYPDHYTVLQLSN